jgi:hypothetical protein
MEGKIVPRALLYSPLLIADLLAVRVCINDEEITLFLSFGEERWRFYNKHVYEYF